MDTSRATLCDSLRRDLIRIHSLHLACWLIDGLAYSWEDESLTL